MMTIYLYTILLILATVFTIASSQEQQQLTNITDDDDPCLGQKDDVVVQTGNPVVRFYRSSFVERCFESLTINKTNTLQHIGALNQIFRDSYCFYNTAKDPPASDPRAHQAELGYTILQGPDEGQVDIDAELSTITERVKSDGATVATFWDVNSVFNRLHDGHVDLPQFRNDSVLSSADMFYVPERCQNGNVTGRHEFGTGPEGELTLKIFWKYENVTEEEESVVKSLNDMDVYSFFLEVSNSPSLNLQYQSIGARFNALLQTLRTNYHKYASAYNDAYGTGSYLWMLFIVTLNSRPSDVYPDSIRVVYANGDEEFYQSAIFPGVMAGAPTVTKTTSAGAIIGINRVGAELALNKAGGVFETYKRSVGLSVPDQINGNGVTPQLRSGNESSLVNTSEAVSLFFDTEYIVVNPDGTKMAAGKIEDGYAVLKVENFEIDSQQLITAWKVLSAKAKEANVKKLIVDISNNGGGTVTSGATLAQLMYPSAQYEFFQKSFDYVISTPMEVYNSTVLPVYDDIINTINTLTDSDLQSYIDILTEDQLTSINGALSSMLNVCNGIKCVDPDDCLTNCNYITSLIKVMDTFETYRSPPLLNEVAQELANLITTIYPGPRVVGSDISDYNRNGFRTVNRGGLMTNLSLPFTIDTSDFYYEAVASAYQTSHNFEEYIIVSNGVGGSATAIFASLVAQLWKNRDSSLVNSSLVSVSYGGLNTTEGDVMMAGFPASNQNVFIEDSLFLAGILFIFNELLKGDSTFSPVISSALSEYSSVLPVPPYFANTLPKLPVMSYYSTFMGEGALPLQYVKMLPDNHIPSYYTQTMIDDAGDLPALYAEASELFLSSSDFDSSSDNGDGSNSTNDGDGNQSSQSSSSVSSNDDGKDSSNDVGNGNQSSISSSALPRCGRAQAVVVLVSATTAGYMFV